jgi:catechol 2,3-dioxygenase-like lactoylglutathione lyase family enzyme
MKRKTMVIVGLTIAACLAGWTAIHGARKDKERTGMVNKSTPILHVKSVEPSLKFWTERFGFHKTIEVPEGDHLGFVALENGPVEIMLQTYSGMQVDPANPLAKAVEQGPSFLFMEVPDIKATEQALKGAEIAQPIHETYGSKEIVAREPGGHFVIFAQMPAH